MSCQRPLLKITKLIFRLVNNKFESYPADCRKIAVVDTLYAHRDYNRKRKKIPSFKNCSNSVCSLLDSKPILTSASKLKGIKLNMISASNRSNEL